MKDAKLYVHYTCDDHIKLYCNGKNIFQGDYTPQIESKELSDDIVNYLHNGENVIAAQGIDDGGGTLLDFGLYVEDKTYNQADTAILKQVDMQTTQTHYVFQCGNVTLRLDFVSLPLLNDSDMFGCPVGFISYQVEPNEEQANIEIIFDVDPHWLFSICDTKSNIIDKWKITKVNDCLYLGTKTEKTTYSYKDGHIVISQRLDKGNTDCGVLFLGYNEDKVIQYEGENLSHYWNRNGKDVGTIMHYIGEQYQSLQKECSKMDCQYYGKALQNKGKKYVKEMILANRAFGANYRFVMSPDNELFCFGNSLGNVREAYKYFPMLLFYNRLDCMKGLLNPIFQYSESVEWVKKYPPHDIGNYPIVNHQVSSEDYGAEVAANMLLMTLAIVKEEKSFAYAEKHWKVLTQWAAYLKEYMTDKPTFSYEFPIENDERIVLGWNAYQELLELR